jgi:glycosyltransferase involved in cell wall biosynthesis
MKTAILMPLAEQRGGAGQLLRLFLRYLPDDPVNWIPIFFESGPLVEEARTLGFDVQILPTGRLRQPIRYTRAVGQLARLFRQKQVTLVLSWMGKAHLYGGVAARVGGIPAIWFQHGIPQRRAWMDRLITRIPAAGVLACSQAAAEAQRQLRPERSIIVVYPAVDLSAFDPDSLPTPVEARRQLGLPENGPLIGMVGLLQRWKGMHTLIQAMPQILERYPEASAVIVGGRHELEPDYEDELRKLIRRRGLQDRVWLAGFRPIFRAGCGPWMWWCTLQTGNRSELWYSRRWRWVNPWWPVLKVGHVRLLPRAWTVYWHPMRMLKRWPGRYGAIWMIRTLLGGWAQLLGSVPATSNQKGLRCESWRPCVILAKQQSGLRHRRINKGATDDGMRAKNAYAIVYSKTATAFCVWLRT